MRLHRLNPNHPGIIICTYDTDSDRLARRIHAAIVANEPLDGKLIRVTRPGPSETDDRVRLASPTSRYRLGRPARRHVHRLLVDV
jgi:hypothetical protein